jgi:hypothetical protein
MYKHLPFQGPPKYTHIGLKINHLATLIQTLIFKRIINFFAEYWPKCSKIVFIKKSFKFIGKNGKKPQKL